MNKKALTETDIRTKFITPALVGPNDEKWNVLTQIREEAYFTKGRVIVRGKTVKRGEAKKADYLLYYKPNVPLAVLEAKDNNHAVGDGMQQALEYAEILDVPFAYSSNGDAFLEHDRTVTSGTVTREIPLDQFPTPDELWSRYCAAKGWTEGQRKVTTQDYYDDGSRKIPRYYQLIAINRTVEAIARGEDRILLVMATGTGKTYTAFQIIWRLWKSGARKRILFLVDRNILADQTKTNDFKPFGTAMTKITNRTVDKSFEIYLCLYQAVTGTDEDQNIYKQFSPDFFDLVIVDECHRGSAADDARWRQVLEYFTSATQIGLTATPKETKAVSSIEYFGDPLYTYSLRQGISDGFLAPYKVVRIGLDKDILGWRPQLGEVDKYGQLIEDREYNLRDFDKNLILEKRTELVAAKVSEFLRTTNRFAKTIVFCETTDHAERMRQAMVNANPDLAAANNKYVMRITGDDDEGKAQLDNFIDPESTYPVVACTSRLMSTGVDAQTCHLIVLDKRIASMTEFKQIIGRGTRINEDYDKFFFTIMDFRGATALFADPTFDGDPVQIYEPGPDDPPVPPDEPPPGRESPDENGLREGHVAYDVSSMDTADQKATRYVVNNVPVSVSVERVQFLDENGRLVTESLTEYTRKTVRTAYASLDDLLTVWNDAGKKQAVLEELAAKGVFLKPGGRAGLVLPDGTLFGEGVKTRIKEALLTECNLHTIVRLPNGVFNPYTGIRTNLLFFTKGAPTTHVWYYEHPYPPGAKSYNKGKPIRIEEFEAERAWWGKEKDGFKSRVENEQAWRVSIDQIKAGNFNLDLKNPHNPDTGPGDVDHLLPEYEKLLAQIAETRGQLKAQLMEALSR